MLFTLLKQTIKKGRYDAADLQKKMDVYLLANSITIEQYQELLEMMA